MNYCTPKEIALEFSAKGIEKANLNFGRFAVLAFLGGAFIAFGGLLTVIVVGGSPEIFAANKGLGKFTAGALFPVGLILVSVAGADLFTSDCAGMALAKRGRGVNMAAVFKVLLLSYIFNFIGTQFVAYFLSYEVGLIKGAYADYLHGYASAKVHQSFGVVFLKGIGANWLVCLGTWMGYSAKDIAGKCIGIWVPVMIFVTLGYEHSIANMFFVPTAIYSGAAITWGEFITLNLVPATLGNIVGGAFFVGCLYWYIYLKPQK